MPTDPIIEPPMREGGPEAPESGDQELDGPDPREWRGIAVIWGLAEDIKALDEMTALLGGPGVRGPATREAAAFLEAQAGLVREQLALALLGVYGITLGEDAGQSPFAHAGKPRAFGADPPPPGNV